MTWARSARTSKALVIARTPRGEMNRHGTWQYGAAASGSSVWNAWAYAVNVELTASTVPTVDTVILLRNGPHGDTGAALSRYGTGVGQSRRRRHACRWSMGMCASTPLPGLPGVEGGSSNSAGSG